VSYAEIIGRISGIIWGPYMIWLLVGTGLLLTVRLGFVQITNLVFSIKLVLHKMRNQKSGPGDGEGEISSFQALATALSSTVGVGNIAGVATAIAIGGPGAMFWMWVAALVGMATKFGEITLAMAYREKDNAGIMRGGAMYIWRKAMNLPVMGFFFALAMLFVAYVNCNMVQTNTAALSLAEYGVPPIVSGIIFAAIIALVIFGGIQRIGKFTSLLVPVMSGIYIIGSLIILVMYAREIPNAFVLIFQGAFGGHSAVGGFAGATVSQAVRFGIARGVFSNEAGCGSAPIAHSAARVKYAAEQGMYGIVEVFLDTIVIGTATALAIIVTGAWSTGADGAVLSIRAFESAFGSFGGIFIAISVILFALSTVIGWSWYGETAASYLFGKRMGNKFILPFRVIWIILSVVGAKMALRPIWATADVALGLAVLTSLTALLILNGKVVKLAKEYFASNEFAELKKEVKGK